MDLIAQAIGAALAFVAGIVGNIFAHDICASANSICARIIKAAAARLADFDQSSTEQEWLADLHEHQTVLEKYRHAVGCFLAAPRMRDVALNTPPFVEDAPGLVWKRRKGGVWEARWQASPELIAQGFKIKSVKLFSCIGTGIHTNEKCWIAETARHLQAEQDQWLHQKSMPTLESREQ